MSSSVLADRDVNASLGSDKAEGGKPKSLEHHRQMLEARMKEESLATSYVSPSDNIMSPCTAKLSAMKQKHFTKAKPQSLFARKAAARAEAAAQPTSAPGRAAQPGMESAAAAL